MDTSGGDPRATPAFTTYWTPADLNLNSRAVPGGAGGLFSDPVTVEFLRTFTLYMNCSAQPVTVSLQSLDLDSTTLLAEVALATVSATGRTPVVFGHGSPIVPGMIFKAIRFRLVSAAAPNVTAVLFGRG